MDAFNQGQLGRAMIELDSTPHKEKKIHTGQHLLWSRQLGVEIKVSEYWNAQ